MKGLRAKLKHEREENVKLKFALRNKIVNDVIDAPTSTALAVVEPAEGEALLSESQALIEPQAEGGWEGECKEYEKLLLESYETRDAFKKELKALKIRNNELEKENRAYKRSLDAIARKRVEDRQAIEQWKQKMQQRDSSPVEIHEHPKSDPPMIEGKRKRPKLDEEADSKSAKVSFSSTITSHSTQDQATPDLFVGRRHASEEPTQFDKKAASSLESIFLLPENMALLESLAEDTRLREMEAEKTRIRDMEARGIPNLISSPVFSSSPPGHTQGKKLAIEPLKIKEEDVEEIEILETVHGSKNKNHETFGGFVVSEYTQLPEDSTQNSLPLALITKGPELSSEATETSSPVHEKALPSSSTSDQIQLETPKSVNRRSSSKFPRVDFAEIDDNLRLPRQSADPSLYMPSADGDSVSKKRSKRKSVLVHLPTPQSAAQGISAEQAQAKFMEGWLSRGNNSSGASSSSRNSNSARKAVDNTPTRRSSNGGLLRAKKAAISESIREFNTRKELVE